MKGGLRVAAMAMLCMLCGQAWAQHGVELERFLRNDPFEDLKISPTGEYFAATVAQP